MEIIEIHDAESGGVRVGAALTTVNQVTRACGRCDATAIVDVATS